MATKQESINQEDLIPHHRPHHETKKGGDGNLGDKGERPTRTATKKEKKEKPLQPGKALSAVFGSFSHLHDISPSPLWGIIFAIIFSFHRIDSLSEASLKTGRQLIMQWYERIDHMNLRRDQVALKRRFIKGGR